MLFDANRILVIKNDANIDDPIWFLEVGTLGNLKTLAPHAISFLVQNWQFAYDDDLFLLVGGH